MSVAAPTVVERHLREVSRRVDPVLLDYLAASRIAPPRLVEAMRYSIESGGKRLRPALVLWSSRACGGDDAAALPAAAAIECVHTFSLIHDDLPAMDDDDLRRGRPTNHVVYGEALAILAGDGLMTLAFEILARQSLPPDITARMVLELANGTGWEGMIGGQVEDIDGEERPSDRALVERIHELKTARLIRTACRLGGLAAQASETQMAALSAYGRELGLAFQIADDLLDVTATADAMGKKTHKDAAAGKQTFPACVGVEESRRLAAAGVQRARAALSIFGPAGDPLADLADFVVQRTS